MPNFDELKKDIQANVKPNGKEDITGQVMQDDLIAMVDATEQVDTSSKARDAKIEADVRGVKTSVSQLSVKVTDIDSKVNEIVPKVDAIENDIVGLKAKDAEQDARLGAVEAKDSEQDARLGLLEGNVERIDNKDKAQDAEIRRIDGVDARQDGEIESLRTDVDDLKPVVDGLEPRIAKNERDIASMQGRVSNAESNIVAIKEKDARQDARLNVIEGDVTKLFGASNEFNISAINTGEGELIKEYSLQEAINALDAFLGEQKRSKGIKVTFVEKVSHKPLTYTFRGGVFTTPSTWEQFDYVSVGDRFSVIEQELAGVNVVLDRIIGE